MLIFKNALFEIAYSNKPLTVTKKTQIYLGKKISLMPLLPSLTYNYPFASTTRQFAMPKPKPKPDFNLGF